MSRPSIYRPERGAVRVCPVQIESLESRRLLSAASMLMAPPAPPAPSASATATSNAAVGFGSVSGTVKDGTGAPLAGVSISLFAPGIFAGTKPDAAPAAMPASGGGGTAILPAPVIFATTDSTGSFSVSQILSGTYTVVARKDGFVDDNAGSVTVTAGANTAIPAIVLAPQQFGSVTGSVTDAAGKPLADATVFLSNAASPPNPIPLAGANSGIATFFPIGPDLSAKTDASGNYSITDVPVGTYVATASKAGTTATSASFAVAQNASTPVPPIQLSLQTGSVSGSVTDSAGHAIAGARITLQNFFLKPLAASPAVLPIFEGLTTKTDSNGNYSLAGVPVGTYVAIASQSGSVSATSASFAVVSGQNTVVPALTLAPVQSGSVHGLVTDANGAAIANATVFLWSGIKPEVDSGDSAEEILTRVPLTATTDQNGAYSIANVPVGSYVATAVKPGFSSASSATFTVVNAADAAIPTISLAAIPTGAVAGSVLNAAGQPASGATVILRPDLSAGNSPELKTFSALTATTDASGNYSIANVPVGVYIATAFDSSFNSGSSASFSVIVGNTTSIPSISLQAPPASCVVEGEIVDGSGAAVPGSIVELTSTSSSHAHINVKRASSNGSFSFAKLAPGQYTVKVLDSARHTLGTTTETVASSTTQLGQITVSARPATRVGITGLVTDTAGKPVKRARVVLTLVPATTGGHARKISATTNAAGAYSFRKIITGSYTLVVSARGFAASAPLPLAATTNLVAPTVALVKLIP